MSTLPQGAFLIMITSQTIPDGTAPKAVQMPKKISQKYGNYCLHTILNGFITLRNAI